MNKATQSQTAQKSDISGPKKLTVFVSGLNYSTKEEDVSLFFTNCGTIE